MPRPPAAVARALARLLALALVLALACLPGTVPSAGAAITCTQDWQPASSPAYLDGTGPLPPPPTAQHRAFHVFCGGRYVNTIWLAPTVTPLTAYYAARDIVAKARLPTVALGANPARGITGLASWFWATPQEAPIRMLPGNGPRIDLELRIQTVRWRFGDGTAGSVSGWGSAYPAPSAVRHVFERTGTFTIDAQVVIVGRFRFEELDFDTPSGGHTLSLRHEVAEVRSLLHAR